MPSFAILRSAEWPCLADVSGQLISPIFEGQAVQEDFRKQSLYDILCTVNTQHTSRQDAIITIRLYLATCFGRKRPSSGQLKQY